MKLQLLILLTLIHGMGFSQTKKIAHKSHSGSTVAYTYLLNHNLLEIDNCGEGMIPDEFKRRKEIDSIHIISKNMVVNFTNNQIDTIIIDGIGKTKSTNRIVKKLSENFGESFSKKTKVILKPSTNELITTNNLLPLSIAGRKCYIENKFYNTYSKRTFKITNNERFPISFLTYLNRKPFRKITLKPLQSKKIEVEVDTRNDTYLTYYLLTNSELNMFEYVTLAMKDKNTSIEMNINFSVKTCKSILLYKKDNVIKNNTNYISTPIQNDKTPNGTKLWWVVSILLVSFLVTGITYVRNRSKIYFN